MEAFFTWLLAIMAFALCALLFAYAFINIAISLVESIEDFKHQRRRKNK